MELHNLKPAKGAVKSRKRIGRGQGSGKGGTSTRGHKGQKSRSGYSAKRAFEAGGIPFWKRVPKRGFNNINRVEFTPINLDRLQEIVEKFKLSSIDPEILLKHNIVAKADKIKILGNGELKAKLEVKAHAFSKSAQEAIIAKGGSVTQI